MHSLEICLSSLWVANSNDSIIKLHRMSLATQLGINRHTAMVFLSRALCMEGDNTNVPQPIAAITSVQGHYVSFTMPVLIPTTNNVYSMCVRSPPLPMSIPGGRG